ncbi:MAG: FAD-dependent oxidoreductase [Enterocloster sp.]
MKGNPYVYTSEGLLNLTELPSRLVIIGGGYIGVEFSSIYASFGSKVTILQDGDIFLPREDEEIAGAVRESLESGASVSLTGVKVKALEQAEGKALVAVDNGKEVQKAGSRGCSGGHRTQAQHSRT